MRIIALPTGHVDVKYINNTCFNEEVTQNCQIKIFGLRHENLLCSSAPRPLLRKRDFLYLTKGNLNKKIGVLGVRGMKKRSKIRTKKELIYDIQSLAKRDRKFLSCKFLSRNGGSSLLYVANKYFGSWNKAVIASGEVPLKSKWTREKVVSELRKMHSQTGQIPNYGFLKRNGNYGLAQAARKYKGSWARALQEIGIKPLRNDFWTKKTLVEEFKKVVDILGHVPPKRELHRLRRHDLVSSGSKFFGSYNNYLTAAGFEPVLIPNIWTKERITKEIINLFRKLQRTPTERDMVACGKGTVVTASIKQFKSWNNAVRAAGLIPNESFVSDKVWKRWESFVLRICEAMYPDSEAHKILPNKSIPDLYDYSTNLIIEVKTNASDTAIYKDVLNYKPYCDKIEIWHLGGFPINTSSKKVTFRGPDYIWNIIKSNKKASKEFNSIRDAFIKSRMRRAQQSLLGVY